MSDENIVTLFNGFLKLRNPDKMKMVNAINEYFDSNEREKIREENDEKFSHITFSKDEMVCIACGR